MEFLSEIKRSVVQDRVGHNPIFIVGYMHSGTTLMRKILGRNQSVFCIRGETSFFDQLPVIRRKFPDLNDEKVLRDFVVHLIDFTKKEYPPINPSNYNLETGRAEIQFEITPQHLATILDETSHFQDHLGIFIVVYNRLAEFAGRERWLEKTPTHIFHVDQITSVLPNSQFVEMVRDPRDILISKRTRRSTNWVNRHPQEDRKEIRISTNYDPLMDIFGWKSAIHAGDKANRKHPNNIRRVRYEDLVANPEIEVKQICNFLGLSFDPRMLDVVWVNTTIQPSKKNKQGIGTASVGKWQKDIDNDAVTICQLMAKEELEKLGYENASIKIIAFIKSPIWFLRSAFEILMRVYRRWRKGGLHYSWTMIKNYIYRFSKLRK